MFFRIKAIAERFGLAPDDCLENIAYARALNSEHQCELLEQLGEELATGNYRLLVIDSIMANFRVDVSTANTMNRSIPLESRHYPDLLTFGKSTLVEAN